MTKSKGNTKSKNTRKPREQVKLIVVAQAIIRANKTHMQEVKQPNTQQVRDFKNKTGNREKDKKKSKKYPQEQGGM